MEMRWEGIEMWRHGGGGCLKKQLFRRQLGSSEIQVLPQAPAPNLRQVRGAGTGAGTAA